MSQSELPHALYTCAQSKAVDELAIEQEKIPGIHLMKRAARFAFQTLLQRWPSPPDIVVVCGSGNNAGDGYVLAALAARSAIPVTVFAVVAANALRGDASTAEKYAQAEGVSIKRYDESSLGAAINDKTVVVDALLGTGITREVENDFLSAIQAINAVATNVLSLDVPSGLCGDSGKVYGESIKAGVTTSFITLKRGLLTGRGPAFTGDLVYDSLGVPEACFEKLIPACERITTLALRPLLPEREADAHKGQFGHVLVVGGDIGMGGAAVLAGEASARSGAGLTSIATQPEHVAGVLARCPELMVQGVPSGQALEPILSKPDVIVLGPGLGRDSWSEQMLQQATLTDLPLVMDADALNLLAEGRVVRVQQRDNWVLTPHPGEAARLLGMDTSDVQADRFAAAQQLQKKYGGVVVLKGAGTIIASKDKCRLAAVGNPGMATGGMGDVLSGVIGALVAQGLALEDAAALAVCVHGDAADCCVADVGERGVLASDLIPYIREFLN